jgi:hypothetical protein
MTKDEALKLALEALACTDSEPGSRAFEREEEAITAIKEALAQPEQEPVAWVDSVMTQAQVYASAWSLVGGRFDDGNAIDDAEDAKKELRAMLAAPPKRPWVGLTATAKLDLLSTAKGAGGRINGDAQLLELLTDHETQLKRKNT